MLHSIKHILISCYFIILFECIAGAFWQMYYVLPGKCYS